jgi:hypothetical protein
MSLAVSIFHDNVSVFIIKTSLNRDDLTLFVSDKELVLQSEHLPPSRVDTSGSSKVVACSIALDFKAKVLPVVVFDGLSNLIEEELLLSCILSPSLEDHIGSSKHLSNSVEWKLRDNIEWSIDVESEFLIQSLSLSLCSLVKIDNLPFLVTAISLSINNNLSSFLIFRLFNIKALSVLNVAESVNLKFEDLEPLGIGAPNLHIICITRVLDIPRLVIGSGSNCKGMLMEVPFLSRSSIGCLDHEVSVGDKVKIST